MPKTQVPTLYCSFCAKSQYEVHKLVAGPAVLICNECIYLCLEICAKDKIGSKEIGLTTEESLRTENLRFRELLYTADKILHSFVQARKREIDPAIEVLEHINAALHPLPPSPEVGAVGVVTPLESKQT